ncbi:hypothetical protein COLO4_15336 [Corchorus olitorius]|uniref:Uncharacterized protein n=1 Tax=Corchorus olitorius TaxID=93759 RepID=A0A1R3JN66_9ROSI|nr:hypothetical protein COLO4_15336 [Corchorus olitorius]
MRYSLNQMKGLFQSCFLAIRQKKEGATIDLFTRPDPHPPERVIHGYVSRAIGNLFLMECMKPVVGLRPLIPLSGLRQWLANPAELFDRNWRLFSNDTMAAARRLPDSFFSPSCQ